MPIWKPKYKLINLTLLSLASLIFTYLFISRLSPVYSTDNSPEATNNDNQAFDCYQKYPETKYPEAQSYCYGLANTKIAISDKIWRNLTAIAQDNPKIIWENNKVNSRLLVVVWTGWDGYAKQVQEESVQTSRDTWITIAPELQEFCKQLPINTKLTLPYRLNQLLGLPPEDRDKNNQRKIVQIWVEPKDLFRPTPDPEITDSVAELNFPEVNWLISISDQYKYWFLKQLMTNDYPWTKLGYTYDWGNHSDWIKIDANRPKNVGLSEFIIREKATIKIHSVSAVKSYCQ